MAEEMANFLYRVSSDPSLLQRFKVNPDAILDATGMSEEDKAIVKSGDARRIEAALEAQGVTGIPITVVLSRG
jgi:hypothetical protein